MADKKITITVDEDVWKSYCDWAEKKVRLTEEEEENKIVIKGNDAGLRFLGTQIERFDNAQQRESQKPVITNRTAIKEKSVADAVETV